MAFLCCPHCDVTIEWHGEPEYDTHRRACAVIELGLLVGQIDVPEVDRKPTGWGWVK